MFLFVKMQEEEIDGRNELLGVQKVRQRAGR